MKNKNTFIIIGVIIFVIIAGIFLLMGSNNTQGQSSTNTNTGGTSQKFVLSIKNYNYYPQVIHAKAGQPISISLDSSVVGCYRTFTVPQLGISKSLSTPSDSVDFTINEKGIYKFACSMGMGTGTIVVE